MRTMSLLSVLALLAVSTALAQAPPTREQSIRATMDSIEAQAQAQGGWDAWYKKLQPFREDLAHILATAKWPWPAKNNFVFYGRSAQLLMIEAWDKHPENADPFSAIVHFDRQCKAKGIDVIFVPIPDKLSIHPDFLSQKTPADRMVFVQSKQMLKRLCEANVEVIDLFTPYHAYRTEKGDDLPLYYVKDGHWNNRGARLAGQQIVERLKRYDFVQKALAAPPIFDTKKGARTDGAKADDDLLHVSFKETGKYYTDVPDSPVVLTGDSFSMYNMQSGAHLSAQVALGINMPISYVCREGLAVDMPVEMARLQSASGYLKGRKVIVWTVRGRCLAEKGWTAVDLSGERKPAPMVRNVAASGTVAGLSARPAKDAPYIHYIMELHVTDLKDAKGNKIADGEGILHMLAMRNRNILPIASVQKGDKLEFRLTTWLAIKEQYDKINAGVLSDPTIATTRPEFWAEPADAATQPAPQPTK